MTQKPTKCDIIYLFECWPLLGHRYYDTRTGRFISQDHARSGGNWYVYADDNPVSKTDPSGLTPMDGPGSSPDGSPGYFGISAGAGIAHNQEFGDNYVYNQAMDAQTKAFVELSLDQVSGYLGTVTTTQMNADLGALGDASDALSRLVPDGEMRDFLEWLATAGSIFKLTNYSIATAAEGGNLLDDGWNVFTTTRFGGSMIPIGAGMMGDGIISYGLAAGAAGLAMFSAGAAGWEAGTWISNQPWGPGGQTGVNPLDETFS